MTKTEALAKQYPVGTLVRVDGYAVTFRVVGHWRGNLRVEEPRFNTTFCVLPCDAEAV